MLAAGYAAPNIEEIFALFHLGGRRRMVGPDRVHFADPITQFVLFISVAQRWSAFGESSDLLHIRRGENQVMRTGLARHIDVAFAGGANHLDTASATDMYYVQTTPGFGCAINRLLNGLQLCLDRTGSEI